MLNRAYALARAKRNPSGMLSAANDLYRLHGLDAATRANRHAEQDENITPSEYLRQLDDVMPD